MQRKSRTAKHTNDVATYEKYRKTHFSVSLNLCKLCPIPGIKAVSTFLLYNLILATLRLAELGFLGFNLKTFKNYSLCLLQRRKK